jgi:hypothetical protein
MIHVGPARKAQPCDEGCLHNLGGAACAPVQLIEPYVSRQLRVRTQTQFELHPFSCEHCLRAVEFELIVKRAIADWAGVARFSRSLH